MFTFGQKLVRSFENSIHSSFITSSVNYQYQKSSLLNTKPSICVLVQLPSVNTYNRLKTHASAVYLRQNVCIYVIWSVLFTTQRTASAKKVTHFVMSQVLLVIPFGLFKQGIQYRISNTGTGLCFCQRRNSGITSIILLETEHDSNSRMITVTLLRVVGIYAVVDIIRIEYVFSFY